MTDIKTAIITDSSCDIPKTDLEKHHIFVLPLQVNMPNGQFLDGVDITPDEIYAQMPAVIPTTSQPSPEYVTQMFAKIKAEGYTEAVAVCMSSGLSGTHDVVKMCAEQEKELRVHVLDSRRLSMALGLLVLQSAEMSEAGKSAADIVGMLQTGWKKTNGLFCIPSLTYLMKGGRIGRVAGTIGNLLGIVPVISIDEDGKYYTQDKQRSYKLAIRKIEEIVRNVVKNKIADIAVLQGGAIEEAKAVFASMKDIAGLRNLYACHISPALGVHTGPGMFGVAYRIID